MQAEATIADFSNPAARESAEEFKAITAAAGGDRIAFEGLYKRHVGRIHGLCLRLTGHRETAEDCVQETFVSAWRSLGRFEARSAFATWLHRIAVNTVLSRRRALANSLETTVDGEAGEFDQRAGDDAPPLDLEASIAALPDATRHVLVLVGLYGFSHKEAADALGIAIGTSKAQFHRARHMLATRLGLVMESI
jgi:RNA polymerase sigma-70 factor (ECF subfamily)